MNKYRQHDAAELTALQQRYTRALHDLREVVRKLDELGEWSPEQVAQLDKVHFALTNVKSVAALMMTRQRVYKTEPPLPLDEL